MGFEQDARFMALDNVPHPIAVLDDDGNFLYRNSEFLEIIGDSTTPAGVITEDNVSHEIRTPLHGIMGMIESLQHSDLDEGQKDCMKYLKFSADALYQIVNHFLDIPKLQCGILELSSEPFSLYDLADSLVNTYRDALGKRDVDMVFEYHVSNGVRKFFGDEPRIRQITANLLSNAVKFTDSSSIVTRVESEIGDCGAHDLTMSVVDTGKGIPEPALVKLFDAFTQFDGEARRLFPYDGIDAEDIEGGGDDEVQEVESGSDGSPLNQRVYRILIAEDNLINQRVLARMMDTVGFHYSIASNGKEALKLSEDMVFDAVFMDCDMPVMDGYEATKAIRMSTSNFCASIPIIAVTASGEDTVRQRCLESGMNDVLMKPVTQKEIMKALQNWLLISDGDD
ncbi:hypothetical protein HK104_002074 [Borealophlyctis nickersoniae]|nr:hypothetical protein HK104_002074 [Borealophlyctis nickersoniae]